MYGEFVKVYDMKVWVWCCPRDPKEELEGRAKAIYRGAQENGLTDLFLKEYLRGEKSMEWCLEQQGRYVSQV